MCVTCTCKHFICVYNIGPEFESRIRQNEINNPKFNFLNPGDPYHAYFQQKVLDIKEQDGRGELAVIYLCAYINYNVASIRYGKISRWIVKAMWRESLEISLIDF